MLHSTFTSLVDYDYITSSLQLSWLAQLAHLPCTTVACSYMRRNLEYFYFDLSVVNVDIEYRM